MVALQDGGDTYGGAENGGSGGGATDIRLTNELTSRIMVAGGGGGAGALDNSNGYDGGLDIGLNSTLGVGTKGISNQSGGGGGGGGYYGGDTNGSGRRSGWNVGLGAYGGSNFIDSNYFKNPISESGKNNSNGYIIIKIIIQ